MAQPRGVKLAWQLAQGSPTTLAANCSRVLASGATGGGVSASPGRSPGGAGTSSQKSRRRRNAPRRKGFVDPSELARSAARVRRPERSSAGSSGGVPSPSQGATP